jgi:lipoprotein-anchoring transpeptidase ErfK/SrfK
MKGGEGIERYDIPDVPYTMYFYADYALHGAYWHNNFGNPMSHGCVNLPVDVAKWMYDWAPIGTMVVTHN